MQMKAGVQRTLLSSCLAVVEDLMIQELFLDQAKIDSIEVSPDNVEADLNNRLAEYIRRAGSEQALETYFSKSMAEIKKDLREMLTNQYIVQETQGTIAQDITVTPDEIKKYYTTMSKDSLPLVPRKVELSMISVEPPDMESSKAEVRQRLLDLRSLIINGESFSALAVLYSEDPGTAPKGGELGFVTSRGEVAKPYAEAAWSLKKGAVSKIVESEFGFHIIQLIDRKGEMVNTRHNTMRPKLSAEQTDGLIRDLTVLPNNMGDIFRRNALNLGLEVVQSPDAVADAHDGDEFSFDPGTRQLANVTQGRTYEPLPLTPKEDDIRRTGGIVAIGRRELQGSVAREPLVEWPDESLARRMTATEQVLWAHRVDKESEVKPARRWPPMPTCCPPRTVPRRLPFIRSTRSRAEAWPR